MIRVKQNDDSQDQQEQDEAEVQIKDSPLNNSWVSHQFKINNKLYRFHGPRNDDVEDLLQILDEMEKNNDQHLPKWLGNIKNQYEVIEEKFNKITSCFQGQIQLDLNQLYITIVYWSIYLSTLSESLNIYNNLNDNNRQQIAQYLPLYTFIYTLSCQICQQIRNKLIWIILFTFLLITPLFVLLDYYLNLFNTYNNTNYNYQGIGFCILSCLIFIHSLINRFLIYYIKKISYTLIATLYNCSFCILISYCIIFKIICFILLLQTTQNDDTYIINNIKDIIQIPLFFILLFISIILIQSLFRISPKQIETDLVRLRLEPNPEYEIQNQFRSYKWNSLIKKKLKVLKLEYITPVLISIFYVVLEIYCYSTLIYYMEQSTIDYTSIVTYSFLIIAIPIYIVFGILIANSNYEVNSLYQWSSLLVGAISSVISIKIWSSIENTEYFKGISKIIGISPPLLSVIWLTVGYFRTERRFQKLFVMFISCYFFAFPIGILLTFSDAFNDFSLAISAYTLLSIGFIPLGFVIIYYTVVAIVYLIELPGQAHQLNFKAYKYINLTSYAIWINSICYIIGFFSLCYFVWNEPSTATGTKKGTVQGLLAIHSVLFILISKALSIEILDSSIELPQEYIRQIDRLKQMITAGSLFPFIILLPISLTRSDETQKNALLACAVGIPIAFQYFKFLMFVKQESSIYQNFFLPVTVVLGWLLILGPIGVLFAILADKYENSSYEFAVFAQLAVAYTILITIIGVTCASIFYSVLLNKEYLEMKKREVLKIIMQLLANHKVFSTQEICSLIFVRYIQENDQIKLTEQLKQGDPTNVVEYQGLEKHIFIEQLVSKPDYENRKKLERLAKRKRKSINQPSESESTKGSLKQDELEVDVIGGVCNKLQDCLFKFIFCRYGQSELQEQSEMQQRKEVELTELECWKESIDNKERHKMPDEKFYKQLFRDDFYCSLQQKKDRTERFWVCIYQKFSEDLSQVLDFLDYIKDDSVLAQYKSFKLVKKSQIQLSLSDFANLLKDNATNLEQSYYDYLWSLALKKYPLFVFNFPELRGLLRFQVKDTPFSQSLYKYEGKLLRTQYSTNQVSTMKTLQKIKSKQSEEVLKEYENRQSLINIKYEALKPSQYRLKLWELCQCLHETLWERPIQFSQKMIDSLANSLFYKLNPPFPDDDKIEKNENWEALAEKVSRCLVEQCKLFDIKMKNKEYKFKMTTTNIFAITLRFYDLYGLATLAFSSEAGWFGENQSFDPINTVDYSAIWSEYMFFFFLAILMSLAYLLLGTEATKQIKNNTFGFDEAGQVATYKSRRFWLSKTIQFISGQFIFVMKTYIDAFICDYSQYPYTLVRSPSVECMSDTHFMYVVLAIVGCGIYYPLSTFLQPTFQFSDNSLDLKYKSTYVVLYIQAKLLILGLGSVFSNLQAEAYLYQMLFSSIVAAILIYSYYQIWPSYVKWFNKIELCFIVFLFYFYFGAFLIMVTGYSIIGWIFLAIAGGPTLCYFGYLIHQEHKSEQSQKNTRVVPVKDTECSQIMK